MKNYLKIGILFLGILLLQNCSKDDTEDIIEDQNPKLLKILNEWGFSPNDIIDMGQYYLVDKHIGFYKNKIYPLPPVLEELNNKNSNIKKILQTHYDYLVKQENRFISVAFASPYHPAYENEWGEWKNAVSSAMSEWNNICNVEFFLTNDYDNADIQVYHSNTLYSFVAGFPSFDGKPGDFILIDYYPTFGDYRTPNEKKMMMVHALGHTIGLLDSSNSEGTTESNIPGTPDEDTESVMAYDIIGKNWTDRGFSYNDIVAAKYLFPSPAISGTNLICGTSQTYTLTGGTATSWLKSSNLQIVSSTGTSVVVQPISSSTQGSGYVDAVTSSGTIRYNVWVGAFNEGGITGTSAVCNSQAYHYTYNPPGGHKPGYTYRWTMPNSSWYIHTSSGNTIFAGPSGSGAALPGQMLVEVNNGCGGWSLAGGIVVYPSYSCP